LAYALQQLINGVTLGMIYGLIAVGYTMVYGIIGMINFAHGDVFMIGAFLSLIALTALSGFGITSVPLALLLTLVFAAGIAAASAWRRSSAPSACPLSCKPSPRSARAPA